jgi:hypothetical protein
MYMEKGYVSRLNEYFPFFRKNEIGQKKIFEIPQKNGKLLTIVNGESRPSETEKCINSRETTAMNRFCCTCMMLHVAGMTNHDS